MSAALGPGAYLLGLVQLAVTVGCSLASARRLAGRALAPADRLARLLATAVLAALAICAAELVPLVLGILSRLTVPLTALLLLALVRFITRRPPRRPLPDSRPASEPRGGPLLGGLGTLLALAAGATLLGYLELAATVPINSVDALAFHLPGVIRFIQTGSLWQTAQYIPLQAQGNYPQFGDLLLLAAALPWHDLALVRYVDPLLLIGAALALFAACRELGASRGAAAVVTLALFSLRPVLQPALPDSLTDPAFLLGWCAGLLFLLRHRRLRAREELLLAGAAFGLALGTKWYALTDVPALLIAWAIVLRPRPREFGTLALTTLAVGCPWLIRNWILTGDPVFDERIRIFGVTIFSAPPPTLRDRIGFSLAHYLTNFSVLREYVWPVFRSDFGLIGLLVALAGLAALRLDRRAAALLTGGVLCAVAYLLTPYTAQGLAGHPLQVAANTRYLVPALVLLAPGAALLASRSRVLRPLLCLALAIATISELGKLLPVGAGRLLISALVLIAVALAFRVGRLPGRPTGRIAVVLALGLLAAYHYQRVLARAPMPGADQTVSYLLAHAAPGSRVGVTGLWDTAGEELPGRLFGPRLRNRVGFVGPFVAHRLELYLRPGPFLAALRRERYPWLEIGNGIPPASPPAYVVWAQRAGYRVVLSSARLTLMRLRA